MSLADEFIMFTPLAKLVKSARLKRYPKSQILLYSGDAITELFILKKGVVKMYDIDHEGNEKILHILKPPGVMPSTFLRGAGESSEWFYSTITDCDIYSISRAEVEEHMKEDSRLAVYLLRQFTSEMHELLIRLSSFGKTDTRDKLTYVLRFLGARHASERNGGWRRVTFPVSHQLLADMIGMTRESTALSMKQLRALNVVRYPRTTVLEIQFKKLLDLVMAAAS